MVKSESAFDEILSVIDGKTSVEQTEVYAKQSEYMSMNKTTRRSLGLYQS